MRVKLITKIVFFCTSISNLLFRIFENNRILCIRIK